MKAFSTQEFVSRKKEGSIMALKIPHLEKTFG